LKEYLIFLEKPFYDSGKVPEDIGRERLACAHIGKDKKELDKT
jgi:hypothetical protein